MSKKRIKMRNVAIIGIACLVVSMFVACGDKNNCKEINSNFETEYAKYNTLHKQFDEYLIQCMQIEGYEETYDSLRLFIGLSWGLDLVSAIHVYEAWRVDIEIWSSLTDSQRKLITDTYEIATKTRLQGDVCATMVNDNPDCLDDKEEFNGKC